MKKDLLLILLTIVQPINAIDVNASNLELLATVSISISKSINENESSSIQKQTDLSFVSEFQSSAQKRIRLSSKRQKEKRYICDYEGCKWAFVQKGDLRNHMRVHTGEKPFICDYVGCKWAFKQQGNLNVHKKTHTGERPFSCPYEGCSSTFIKKSHLAGHKEKHT